MRSECKTSLLWLSKRANFLNSKSCGVDKREQAKVPFVVLYVYICALFPVGLVMVLFKSTRFTTATGPESKGQGSECKYR